MQNLPKKNYYPGLDALRGVAVLSVVLYHYFIDVSLFRFGWIGVDLFFVISGFLISEILIRSKGSNHYFANFYGRRQLRILPAYLLLLIIFFSVALFFDTSKRLSFYKHNWWWYFLFLQNWLFVFKGMPEEWFLNHLWSLAVEEQFYLIFPLLVALVTVEQLRRIIFFLLPLICIIRTIIYWRYPNMVFFYYCNTFTRIDSVLFGCLLGCGYRPKKTASTVFILFGSLILLTGCVLWYRSFYPMNPAMATIGYTLLALFFHCGLSIYTSRTDTFRFFRFNIFLNFIGKISYGIYLFHIPVYLLAVDFFSKWPGENKNSIVIASVSFVITIGLATASFFMIEKHFLRLKSLLN